MARVLLVVTGVVAAVVGAVLLVTGSLFAAAFGPSSSITSAGTEVTADGVALLLETLDVDPVGLPLPETVGTLTLTATSDSDRPVFVGVARPDDVDTYLVGAPYGVVVGALPAGGTAETRSVPGTQQPAPPGTQQFWLRQDSGAAASVPARIPPGAAVVVMNDDATPGVAAILQVTLEVENGWTASIVAIGCGLVLVVLALVLVRVGVRRPRRPGAHSASAGAGAAAGERVSAADVVPGAPLAAAGTDAVAAGSAAADAADSADGLAPPGAGGG